MAGGIFLAVCRVFLVADCRIQFPNQGLNARPPALGVKGGGCFPGGSEVKNLPTMQETWVESLGQKDPLEKGMASHSSILAWKIPWAEESGGLQFMGLERVRHN